MFRQMHAMMEGFRAVKILEQFRGDLPTYMPKRSVQLPVCTSTPTLTLRAVILKLQAPGYTRIAGGQNCKMASPSLAVVFWSFSKVL